MSLPASVLEFQNYREFLKNYYQHTKLQRAGFTYARFSAAAGIKSPNYLKLVMDGKKNLTAENIIRFSKALHLQDYEADYFEALVHFNQAKNSVESEYYQERLNRVKDRFRYHKSQERTLEEYEFESVTSWIHHTIMVLTHVKGFEENTSWIRKRLYDLSTDSEVRKILQRLLDLKLISRNSSGRLVQTHRQVKTRPDLKRLAAQIFYEGILCRAIQALKLNTPDEREFGCYFVGLSAEQLPELKKRVREFMKSLNDWALSYPHPKQVYAFTFCGFPVTSEEKRNPSYE